MKSLEKRIFVPKTSQDFDALCMEIFKFQYTNNYIYRQFCDLLQRNPQNVKQKIDVPFLPIEFFKTHKVVSGRWKEVAFFQSSGTTSSQKSTHFIKDLSLYERSFVHNFNAFWGNFQQYCFLVALPLYSKNPHSSLIYMMNYLVSHTRNNGSRFFNEDLDALIEAIMANEKAKKKTILFGVTYALLDIIEKQPLNLQHTLVFETGGMKGQRAELTKEELHLRLCEGFNVRNICSEYGMCELFSQVYSAGNGIFHTTNGLFQVAVRDINDPLSVDFQAGKGAINVIDLANLYSCSFIATADLGQKINDQTFKLLGRLADSDVRGCNLLYL
ncbi:MAG: acyltransferase [Bacteroidales bacterium]|jgi:hypothetical protein|nr:acyltransferase [Bacteroidales bacterium]